jgi:hypothetical protein
MSDWTAVAANAIWIAALSALLAAWSYHHWLAGEAAGASTRHDRGWLLWSRPPACAACLGWAFAQTDGWGIRLVWLALAASFAWEFAAAVTHRTR